MLRVHAPANVAEVRDYKPFWNCLLVRVFPRKSMGAYYLPRLSDAYVEETIPIREESTGPEMAPPWNSLNTPGETNPRV